MLFPSLTFGSVVILSYVMAIDSFLYNNYFAKVKDYRRFSSTDGWVSLGNCEVIFPVYERIPRSIIHFTGGFIVGSAVSLSYGPMLQYLATKGHLVVATSLPPLEYNHFKIASDMKKSFYDCYQSQILPTLGSVGSEIPVIGLGHSLGGKLMVISGAANDKTFQNNANIFLAFNNYGIRDSIEMTTKQRSKLPPELQKIFDSISFEQIEKIVEVTSSPNFKDLLYSKLNIPQTTILNDSFDKQISSFTNMISQVAKFAKEFDFQPNSSELWELCKNNYDIKNNLIIKFNNDEIDQSNELMTNLRQRRSCIADLITVPGNHLTPNLFDLDDPDSLIFLKELNGQIESLADKLWGSTNNGGPSSGPEKYYLPGSSGPNSGGIYLPGGGESSRWDSDNF